MYVRETHTQTHTHGVGECMYVRHTHTHTHFILAVSRCLPSLPVSTLTLSLAQVLSSAPQMSAPLPETLNSLLNHLF